MIWQIDIVDSAFIDEWEEAGQPGQAVIDAYLRRTKKTMHPQAARTAGDARYYYLLRGEPRIRLSTIGTPLAGFAGQPAKIIVGTREIIGEFAGNRDFVGQKGLQLKMEAISKLIGPPDEHYPTATAALLAISEQRIDADALERNERREREWRQRAWRNEGKK